MTLALCRTIWVLAALALTCQSRDVVPLEAGMITDRSVMIRPGTYRLSAPEDLARPVITVRGHGITVDFNGAVLAGGLDDWAAHESKVSRVPVGEGRHRFKVEYDDVTGFAELRFDIQRK